MKTRVCPFCGEPPGDGVFCAECGRNLTAVQRLPTRAEWEAGEQEAAPTRAEPEAGAREATPMGEKREAGAQEAPPMSEEREAGAPSDIAERCAAATAEFLDAMRAAGNPGVVALSTDKRHAFRKPPQIEGWVLRPVDREDFEGPRRYEPGIVLAVDGSYHRLDSELRGWGQREFPRYEQKVSHDPIEMPAEERLLEELRAARDG